MKMFKGKKKKKSVEELKKELEDAELDAAPKKPQEETETVTAKVDDKKEKAISKELEDQMLHLQETYGLSYGAGTFITKEMQQAAADKYLSDATWKAEMCKLLFAILCELRKKE